ncbi:MAG: pantoate--beta-alanine ligase [Sporomusaceae bacterium]|nr:pantoate--beta-alanine ligase [Sporomusaceae bacterium]
MEIITTVAALREKVKQAHREGKSLGLVPTMGYLHDGHLTLAQTARSENDIVVLSIFVNPLQFGQGEDFAAYPRDLACDSQKAATAGVDFVFAPSVEEMYPFGYENMMTFVEVKGLTEGLCGQSRPGHFRGVATVVTKLFQIAQPDKAYFGQKDAQQVAVIKKLVADLNMDITIVTVPIVREKDGLALSSRNVYLNQAERSAALVLSKSLALAKRRLQAGERNSEKLLGAMRALIEAEPLAQIDYAVIVDNQTLAPLPKVQDSALIALAVRIGRTRLIDNIVWERADIPAALAGGID